MTSLRCNIQKTSNLMTSYEQGKHLLFLIKLFQSKAIIMLNVTAKLE